MASTKPATPPPRDGTRALLDNSVLFRKLAQSERTALASRARIRKFPAGESIFVMGDQHDSMLAVLSGQVKISVPSAEGKEVVLALLHEGEVFGEIAMLDGKARSADATALTDCTLAILERAEVLAVLNRSTAAWIGFVEVLCARLRRTDQHLVEVAFLDLPMRLAKALLRATANEIGAGLHLSQRELGSMIGASRESVNKCLQEWQRLGIVRIDRGTLYISKRAKLEEVAEP